MTRFVVLLDSYDVLGSAPAVANAELPGAGNPCGHPTNVTATEVSGDTDEGRAMAQIVHDLAPGAAIRFASAMGGQPEFAGRSPAWPTRAQR